MQSLQRLLLVIPCYNEAKRLPVALKKLVGVLNQQSAHTILYDVIVADDGSKDEHSAVHSRTVSDLQGVLRAPNRLRYVRFEKNGGKGHVLHTLFSWGLTGTSPFAEMAELDRPTYDLIGFLDADGSTEMGELHRLALVACENPQLATVIGSRVKMLGYNVDRFAKRHYSGRIFATFVSEMFNIPIYDSQCGAKVFRTSFMTQKDLDICYQSRWLFDTQLVLWTYQRKQEQLEVPIHWIHFDDSKVSLLRDPIKMIWGLWKFRRRTRGLS